ncbi:DeoR family transcriptional regulator [Haloactinospora alba]|uniref:DeoR family transcriptional regulator n=1 Tax=Haloactinospora alba TaxID=405555 RepID=A0A543NJ40_9ACTN|nr:DeoR/GlpR family DNA-binding transcription regulator [Haloactinospora alba]TQN31852.1 DeoR family transcriptional regulator [Haloactinospora alba]
MTAGATPTFTAQRRERILELLRVNRAMALRDIARQVRASEATVRRDVRALESDGLLDRRRGGAVLPGLLDHDPPADGAGEAPVAGERALAYAAARLVGDNDTIALGPGRKTEALAHEIAHRNGLTVVTTSLPVAEALSASPGVEVVVSGGTLHGPLRSLVGSAAEQTLRGLRVRRSFLSGDGVTADRGLSTSVTATGSTERALVSCAEEAIVLADHTAVGTDTMVSTAPPEHIAHLVTDNHADPEVLLTLEETGTVVHVAVLESDRGE